MMKNNLGIYIHLPFCKEKCSYCDFTSFCADEKTQSRYIDDLLKEVSCYRSDTEQRDISTLYFGGGTPSALSPFLLEKLFRGLPKQYFSAEEITFEMNPESVSLEKLSILKEAGVNRISLGIQSFADRTLDLLGRIHSAEEGVAAVHHIRQAGFKNLNVDLMYAIGEDYPVEESVRNLVKLKPDHISTYPLELYDHRPLSKILQPVDDALSAQEFSFIHDELIANGYVRYEVSNFAKPGYASKHNIGYWERTDYLGLGVSAHSLLGSHRHSNCLTLATYHDSLSRRDKPIEERVELTREDQAFEMLMLGLRLTNGVDLSLYRERYGDLSEGQKKSIMKFRDQGLIDRRKDRLALTPEGMNLMNLVLVELME